ncbi:uncharacterized protein LOC144572008 isoform X2 [Carex rostrata]
MFLQFFSISSFWHQGDHSPHDSLSLFLPPLPSGVGLLLPQRLFDEIMLSSNGYWTRRALIGLVLGQLVSLLVTSTGLFSSELSRLGIDAPTSQSFLNYLLLGIIYGCIVLYQRRPLQMKWYYYLMLGLVDVEANYLGGSAPVKGDVLVIVGSTLYAICNVSEEVVVKSADRIELMAMLGFFGAIVSACQIIIFERMELESIHWTKDAVVPFVGFSVAMFLFYSTVPVLLKMSGSTMLNLSLLTSDMWAILIRIFAYHEEVDWIYYMAFVAVALGLVTYSSGTKEDEATFQVGNEADIERKGRGEVAVPDMYSPVCMHTEEGAYQVLKSEEQL